MGCVTTITVRPTFCILSFIHISVAHSWQNLEIEVFMSAGNYAKHLFLMAIV